MDRIVEIVPEKACTRWVYDIL